MADKRGIRELMSKRLEALRSERSPWDADWRELSEYIAPTRGRFATGDRSRSRASRRKKIINSRATQALRTLSAGMASNIVTPTRPWFRLGTEDPALSENGAVRTWLEELEKLLGRIFSKSNLYQTIPSVYSELGAFGTAALSHDEDFENVVRFTPHAVGEYFLANDERGQARTFYRELQMTVEQVVRRFSLPRCSQQVRNLYDNGNYDGWVTVCQGVERNDDRFLARGTPRDRAYVGVYWEAGGRDDLTLETKGYHECPTHACRWDIASPQDVYGTSPGMDALGDVKALQLTERRIAQAVDKKVLPPLQGPPLINHEIDQLPGAYNPRSSSGAGDRIESLYDPRAFSIAEADAYRHGIEERINEAFYADLFLMLSMSDRRQITATEINERQAEKLLQLGPVLTRLDHELLNPLIDRTSAMVFRASAPHWAMGEAGMLPPPPQELQGVDLKVDYLSMLHQAQKSIEVGPMREMLNLVTGVGQIQPESLVKFDGEQFLDEAAARLGTPVRIIRDDETVAAIKEAQAKQAEQQQAAQTLAMGADAASKLGRAKMDGTALGELAAQGSA